MILAIKMFEIKDSDTLEKVHVKVLERCILVDCHCFGNLNKSHL